MAAAVPIEAGCFHCGLEIAPEVSIQTMVGGVARPMCCAGCAAVAELLEAQGLASWYVHREQPTGLRAPAIEDVLDRVGYLDVPDLEAEFETHSAEGTTEATLLVDGIHCAACVWVIERHVSALPGVVSVRLNGATHRARLVWDPSRNRLRDLIVAIAEIGFEARPDRPELSLAREREESRRALIRLGVAGLGTMNVMTYAVGLYLGVVDGMAPGYQALLRWLCWLVATPVVAISARPFFQNALRGLRVGRVGMDLPVALAIGGAYSISAWAVVRGEGEIYFDSACMFTFFLSLGRYVEMHVRHRAAAVSRSLTSSAPAMARRLVASAGTNATQEELVPARSLVVGDRIVVRAGETIAADGRVVEGRSAVEESLLTGESWPRAVGVGAQVLAGSLNAQSPLVVEAESVRDETRLASILALTARAETDKPPIATLADRVASVFVLFVLGVTALAALAWLDTAPERAIEVTLAVLVATCPCALGLATPAALAAATNALAMRGLLLTRGRTLEGLATIDHVVLDKTGTLSSGDVRLARIVPCASAAAADERTTVEWAASLEARSEHPIARAVRAAVREPSGSRPQGGLFEARAVEALPGFGIEGEVEGRRMRFGRPDWALGIVAPDGDALAVDRTPPDDEHVWSLLASRAGAIAWLGFSDPLRPEAAEATASLAALGLETEMLSGDPSPFAITVADRLGLEQHAPSATPEQKLARLRDLQAQGSRVLAVGDGINDGPILRGADVSIAMGSGSDATRAVADGLLVHDDLTRLPAAIRIARKTRRIMRQNFFWAVAYNLCALPAALGGWLSPWLAALGMSASSLVVVFNSARLAGTEGER